MRRRRTPSRASRVWLWTLALACIAVPFWWVPQEWLRAVLLVLIFLAWIVLLARASPESGESRDIRPLFRRSFWRGEAHSHKPKG